MSRDYLHRRQGQRMWDGLERKHGARLRWFGHVGPTGERRLVYLEADGEDGAVWKAERGRPIMDAVREDMIVVEVTEDDADDRTKWGWKICCGDP